MHVSPGGDPRTVSIEGVECMGDCLRSIETYPVMVCVCCAVVLAAVFEQIGPTSVLLTTILLGLGEGS